VFIGVFSDILVANMRELRNYPTEHLINPEESGLKEPSIIMAHQIRAIAKERLAEKCGAIISLETRDRVRSIIRLYLDLL